MEGLFVEKNIPINTIGVILLSIIIGIVLDRTLDN
jgi:hypothetical protein